MSIFTRIQHAWDAFANDSKNVTVNYGGGRGRPNYNPSTSPFAQSGLKNIAFSRIAVDVSMTDILHVKQDANGENQIRLNSNLQSCLSIEANIDQSGRAFMHDLVYSLLDEGCVAAVPVKTTNSPIKTGNYDINSLRVGKIVQWFPQYVRVQVYNEETGNQEEVMLPKSTVAIIQNPFSSVLNGNITLLNRINQKMAQIDNADEIASSGNLNILFQVPYVLRTEKMRKQAESRRKELESQLSGDNKFGIGMVDGTEKVTQLNRTITNSIQDEIKQLTDQFYSAIGLTENVMNGTAGEQEMLTYYARTVDPIMDAILKEFTRKFITKTARSQGQTLIAYRDPFKLVPVEKIAEMTDVFRRDQVLTSNEIRPKIGYPKSSDPLADKLSNPSIADANQDTALPSTSVGVSDNSGQ